MHLIYIKQPLENHIMVLHNQLYLILMFVTFVKNRLILYNKKSVKPIRQRCF